MGSYIDLTGQRFGKLTVLRKAKTNNRQVYFECICDCGEHKIVRSDHLRKGKTTSCGCHSRLVSAQAKIKRNKIEICGDYAKIYLFGCEDVCLIDREDIDKVKDYCWAKNHYGYVSTHIDMEHRLLLHRLLFDLPQKDKRVVDHINHDTLDNRRKNLRVLFNNTYNLHNLNPQKSKSKTGFMNVYEKNGNYHYLYKRFGKKYYGYGFASAEEANEALIKSYKENNFIYGE